MEGTKTGLPDEFDVRLYVRAYEYEMVRQRTDDYNGIVCTLRIKDSNDVIDPQKMFIRLHCLTYAALDQDAVWKDNNAKYLLFLWKPYGVNTIHLEWMGKKYHGLPIKVDVMYCTHIEDWWPEEARTFCPLLSGDLRKRGCSMVLRPYGWQASACDLEKYVMMHLPLEPLLAYMVCKVINILEISKRQLQIHKNDGGICEYVIREHLNLTSYMLKNALFF